MRIVKTAKRKQQFSCLIFNTKEPAKQYEKDVRKLMTCLSPYEQKFKRFKKKHYKLGKKIFNERVYSQYQHNSKFATLEMM